jgi:hypothetical protein
MTGLDEATIKYRRTNHLVRGAELNMNVILSMFQVCLSQKNFLPHEVATPECFSANNDYTEKTRDIM